MMAVHRGAGVLPGRYAGEPIRLHEGPTPQQIEHDAAKRAADVLAGRIGAAAALSAQSECTLLELVGEFDATNAIRFWTDVKSLAHWLSWCCSMNLGVAREHVRVARLRRIPKRQITVAERDDGMVEIKARLSKEEAAVIVAAMESARDQFGPRPLQPSENAEAAATPTYSRADALVDVARAFLNTAPAYRSGEDRHLVVVHVDADLLTDPAPAEAEQEAKDVPAGTSLTRGAVCHIDGVGSVEPATAQRLACDATTLLGAVTNAAGEVLALGRTRRLVSRAQRRALAIRDGMCRYPGCAQTRHLDAHHVVPWAAGGATDLENLILLCRFHHTAVHEGGVTITETPGGWQFTLPDGSHPRTWQTADTLTGLLAGHARRTSAALEGVDRFDHPDARIIRPRWAGETFSVHDCVQALFTIRLPDTPQRDQDQQQAA